MDILNPNEIGARIATMILESKHRFIAISPYVKISDWRKMNVALENALERGVSVEFYYREMKEREYNYLNSIGVKTFEIPKLHTKLYINDSNVLLGSMNLYETSDLFTRELAVYFDDRESYDQFYDYYSKYIETVLIGGNSSDSMSDLESLRKFLIKQFNDIKINNEEKYLFCKNLVGNLQVMIFINSITLKLGKIDPDDELIQFYSKPLSHIKEVNLIPEEPTESYRYMTWKIDIHKKSYEEIGSIFQRLREVVNS